jgi:tetratricopeptide (TPR) repeat protein
MSPERFRQIEELYHAAREATAGECAALLAQTDPELRREVELLLSQPSGGEFLDRTALQNAPELLEDSTLTGVAAGAWLGPYRIEHKIGEGGMGEVFRAIDTRLGRPVAIKFAHERFSAGFDREARAISSLNHPNICTLYDIGPNYLVMELLEGDTIAARLKKGPLPVDQALRYASQIAAALADAHEHGIVHRDLKPGNIMLSKSGVKVLDFGIATLEGDHTLTGSRRVMGTPAYMAPEQREGKPSDAGADLYSFGCVLYEMLTGVRATPDRKPVPSKTLEKVVSRCLEPDPARRWQSAVELVSALETPPRAGKNGFWTVPAGAILVALIIVGYFVFRPAPRLTAKDTIVLADFVNNTGDPIFDGTLRQGMAIQLEQSPFLKIMDDQQVQGVLRLMSLPPGSRITNPIAHQICVRDGAAATIDGAIASLGTSYVITLQAIACPDGKTLAREQIQAVDKEHVLNAVGSAAAAIRGKLGESRNLIQKLNRPLEQATTPSLEALQNYSAGYSEKAQGHFLAAVPLFERAIEIDPNFAAAYLHLGDAFFNAGDEARSREYLQRAFSLVDRVSEYERYWMKAEYYLLVTGEVNKAIDDTQLGIRNYPQAAIFHNGLSMILIDLGQYEEGLKEGLEAARLQPEAEMPYRRQLDAYICLDRLTEARELMDKLRAQGLGGARIHQRFLEMAYVAGDQAAADREIQWFAGKPEDYLSLGLQAANRNVHGQRRESHKLYQRAAEAALRLGLRNAASEFEEADARADALAGNCQTVRRLGRPALAVAMCGDAVQAEKLAAETSRLFPNGTIWNAVQLPEIRAAIALNRDQLAKSVELLVSAAPYERSYLEAVHLRGLAYLRLKKGAEAAAEFRKIVDHRGANWASLWRYPYWGQFYSVSYLGMARGSALAGDTANARKAFQDFLELWKDADPDVPILQQAKAEYAKLR